MIARWMDQAASRAETIFRKHGVQLTLGGEPTYVPTNPEGPGVDLRRGGTDQA